MPNALSIVAKHAFSQFVRGGSGLDCSPSILRACYVQGKKRIIAETGAGQHGVATATVCARYGLECIIYMGANVSGRSPPSITHWRFRFHSSSERSRRIRMIQAEPGTSLAPMPAH